MSASLNTTSAGASGGALDGNHELIARLRELGRSGRLLVALDFDGTLAPEVDKPGDARALPEARRAVLELLGLPATRVALISGRAMDSLREVSALPEDVLLVGSHGVEVRLDGHTRLTLDATELGQVDLLKTVLDGVAARLDYVWIESKPAGFALHTRLASEEDTRQAHVMALAKTREHIEGLTVREGKNVLEFSLRSTTKGEGLLLLKEYANATAVLYAGDDVTDEDAFAVLGSGDLGLKSGPGETVAEFRVNDEAEVARVLSLLAAFRAEECADAS